MNSTLSSIEKEKDVKSHDVILLHTLLGNENK